MQPTSSSLHIAWNASSEQAGAVCGLVSAEVWQSLIASKHLEACRGTESDVVLGAGLVVTSTSRFIKIPPGSDRSRPSSGISALYSP